MVAKRFAETVRRRLRAGRMLLAGKTPAQAAQAVGVARQTAHTWKAMLDEGSIDALRAMPGRVRPARLDEQQLQALGRMLMDKPTGHGFGTEQWTLKRVAVAHELHVQAAPRQHEEGTAGRVPAGAACALEAAIADHPGRPEGAPQQAGARIPGLR